MSNPDELVGLVHQEAFEKSGVVNLLIPGMLYDASDPPNKSILERLKVFLGGSIAYLELNDVERSNKGSIVEMPVDSKSDAYRLALEALESSRHISRINILSHSVGSLTAATLVHEIEPDLPIGGIVLMSPVSQYGPSMIALQVRAAIEKLIGEILPVDDRGETFDLCVGDSGKSFIISPDVWSSISNSAGTYRELMKSTEIPTHVAVGDQDRVFDPRMVAADFSRHNVTVLNDTHSLKEYPSLLEVSGIIRTIQGERV